MIPTRDAGLGLESEVDLFLTGMARMEGADAMHAWVSAWCGTEVGWIEFDPTNACIVEQNHIAAAHGRDYLKGVLRTSGNQVSHQQVDVKPV